MKTLSKYLDRFQIAGFVVSLAISIGLILMKQDTIPSLLIGLVLGVLTQLFDLQARLLAAEERSGGDIERAIRSLKGVDVRRLANSQEMWRYLTKRISKAQGAVDDMTISASWMQMTPAMKEAHDEYLKAVYAVLSKKDVKWREVVAFPYFLARAETMLERKPVNYHLRYCEFEPRQPPIQLLQFMVVDSEEVILVSYGTPEDTPVRLVVKHPDIVMLFQGYYDSIWNEARILREGDKTGLAALSVIRERLSGEKGVGQGQPGAAA